MSQPNKEKTCPECNNGNIEKEYDDKYGKHVKEFSCGHTLKIVVVQDTLSLEETAIVTKGFYFGLTKSFGISGIKKNSNDLELVFDKDDPNLLIAFKIAFKDIQSEEEILNAHKIANRFTNFLSLKTGLNISHNRPLVFQDDKISTSGFTMDAFFTKLENLDLTDEKVKDFLNTGSETNQMVGHFAHGLKALELGNYSEAIREFFIVVEHDTKFPNYDNLRCIRHGLTHKKVDDDKVWKVLEKLGFELINLTPTKKQLDVTSSKNHKIIELQAKAFRDNIVIYADSNLGIKTN